MTVEERLWSHVEPEPNSGCWIWVGGRDKDGYGRTTIGDGEKHWYTRRAHRVMYELLRATIAPRMTTDHTCRTRPCVNPNHLEIVSVRVNTLRGNGPAAENARRTHCQFGHPLSSVPSRRYCRVCHRVDQQRYLTAKEQVA